MNKEEILKYLNYKGKYTKDVKRRLNKLLKKYHPDNNKDDKKTILILYDIKKELEDGTLEYSNNSSIKVNSRNDVKNNFYVSFFESMIERLKIQREKINIKINNLYKKINFHNEKIDDKQDELSYIEFEVSELEKEINELLKIDIIDKFIIIMILLFILFAFLFKNIIFIIIGILFVGFEIYYFCIRKRIYNDKKNRLQKSIKRLERIKNEFISLEDRLEKLERDELRLKGEKTRINNDIQYYSHEISKLNEKEYDKDYSKENVDEKAYTKR